MYISVGTKFLFSLIIAFAWLAFCTWFSYPWIQDISVYIGWFFAWLIIGIIALIPGFMNAFLVLSYLIDKRPQTKIIQHWPNISFLIPALNEQDNIKVTIESVLNQEYPGLIEVIVIDNGSQDNTLSIVKTFDPNKVIILQENTPGKSHALNKGLAAAQYEFIISIDADTYLWKNATTELMTRFLSMPEDTAAVAGSIYVKNSRINFMTKIQQWDYFISIALVKRIQSLMQGTLVAQGAVSLYKKRYLVELGGWPPTVGEDIVLSWGMLSKGYRIGFAENAIAFTNVPFTYKQFFLQRSRWARGMIEAFIAHPGILIQKRLSTFVVYWNLLFPLMDTAYVFFFIPSIIAAFFGYYFLVGPMTLAILPLSILMNSIVYFGQKNMFEFNDLKTRKNIFGFIFYMLFYYFLMVPACLYGYLSEIFVGKKKWGTK